MQELREELQQLTNRMADMVSRTELLNAREKANVSSRISLL